MSGLSTPSSKLAKLYEDKPARVDELIGLLKGDAVVYIDYANIKPWSTKLGWHIDIKRLKQLLDAIGQVKKERIYYGTLIGDKDSEKLIADLQGLKYEVTTKPVKKMRLSIDAQSIPEDSPSLLKDFVRYPLLRQFTLEEIKYLNGILYRLNSQGIRYIEDWKCNFDVEIGRHMLEDFNTGIYDTYVFMGGDSDFEAPIRELLEKGKNVILLATVRRISRELSDLIPEGLIFYEIKKIKEFICWPKELKR